jgi:hypothetical protein
MTVARNGPAEKAGSLPIRFKIRGTRLPRTTDVKTIAAVVMAIMKLPIVL